MKKIVAIIVALVSTVFCFADDLTILKGSVSVFKGSVSSAVVRWDYSHSTIEGKEINEYLQERGEDWVRDYDSEIKRAEDTFLNRFNKKQKYIKASVGDDAEYEIVIKVKNFNYGVTALAVVVGFGAGDAHLYGNVEIYKKGQVEPIAVIYIDGVGGCGYGNEKRRINAYEELAESLASLIKKGK